MKTFNDIKGTTWTIRLDTNCAKRVRDLASFDLMTANAGTDKFQKLLTDLANDLFVFGSVLWAMCKPEADSRGLDPEAFAALFDGEALGRSYRAVVEEVADFFDKFRQTPILGTVMTEIRRVSQEVDGQAVLQIRKKAEEVLAKALKEIDQPGNTSPTISGEPSTTPPAESESTPDLSPSAS